MWKRENHPEIYRLETELRKTRGRRATEITGVLRIEYLVHLAANHGVDVTGRAGDPLRRLRRDHAEWHELCDCSVGV